MAGDWPEEPVALTPSPLSLSHRATRDLVLTSEMGMLTILGVSMD